MNRHRPGRSCTMRTEGNGRLQYREEKFQRGTSDSWGNANRSPTSTRVNANSSETESAVRAKATCLAREGRVSSGPGAVSGRVSPTGDRGRPRILGCGGGAGQGGEGGSAELVVDREQLGCLVGP